MSVVLITGAYGFVGTNLSAYLAERGHEVWALDVVGGQADGRPYTRVYQWEDLDKIPWNGVDAVIHLAGKAHDTSNTSDPRSYFDVNVGLTRRVVEKWVAKESKRETAFILFSSVKAVADQVEGTLTEEAVPNPQTPYGQSKLEAEKLVQSAINNWQLAKEAHSRNGATAQKEGGSSIVDYCESAPVGKPEAEGQRTEDGCGAIHERMNSRTNELPYYLLRPCMIHGPGNKGNLNLLHKMVKRGVPWPLGGFENKRSFASIGNVCAVVNGLLSGGVASGAYQVADDEAISTNELIGLMSEAVGKRAKIWRLPPGGVRAIARTGDLLRLPLNSERLKKLTESYVVSNAKVKRALGWEKMPVVAREGMRKTLESFSRKGAKT